MRKISIAFLFTLLCVSLFMTFPSKAATVWSDDFDDGDYEGWTVTVGSFSAEENTLEAGTGAANLIYHSSSVATGTWSFDISPGGTYVDVSHIHFMCSDAAIDQETGLPVFDQSCYLVISPDGSIGLWRLRDADAEMLIGFDIKIAISGWRHIDVTRNSDGRICVYQDGNLVIDAVGYITAATSQFFVFWNSGEEATIDNIVVSNTVDILPPTPTPFYMETWFITTVGAVVLVAAFVIIAVMMRRK